MKRQILKPQPISINLWTLIGYALIFIAIIFSISYFINDSVVKKQNAAKKLENKLVNNEKDKLIKEYRKQYEEVLKINSQYKSSWKEIVDLLYNKDMPIGGFEFDSNVIKESDDIILLKLRNTILSMKDDLMLINEVKNYVVARKEFSDNFPFIWPTVKGGVPYISSKYGLRDDDEVNIFDGGYHFHAGIDIPGDLNDIIVATAGGQVIDVQQDNETYGKVIIIQHKYGFETRYAHLNKTLIKPGDIVEKGQKIGLMGNSGYSLGVHLHYEIRKDGTSVDPMMFLTVNY